MDEEFRQKLIKYVKDEDIPPSEAEAIARQVGIEPFRMQQTESETVTMLDGYWPIGFAILWVSWRDKDLIAEQWERFRVFGKFLWNDPQDDKQLMSLSDAEAEVWRALRAGHLPANGIVYPSPVVLEIPRLQWLNLEWTRDHHRWAARYRHQADPRYSDVKLGRQEVLNLWPSIADRTAVKNSDKPKQRPNQKRDDVVQALLELYPNGAPQSVDRAHMRNLVIGRLGRQISLKTLDRARKEAWPT